MKKLSKAERFLFSLERKTTNYFEIWDLAQFTHFCINNISLNGMNREEKERRSWRVKQVKESDLFHFQYCKWD
jgi:hypothetical protein